MDAELKINLDENKIYAEVARVVARQYISTDWAVRDRIVNAVCKHIDEHPEVINEKNIQIRDDIITKITKKLNDGFIKINQYRSSDDMNAIFREIIYENKQAIIDRAVELAALEIERKGTARYIHQLMDAMGQK